MLFCYSLSFVRWLCMYLPHGIQDTPYQQQFVWKTTLGHILPALEHFPVQDDTYREFHGFSSDSPASHHTPSTPWPWLDELTAEKEHGEHFLSTINFNFEVLYIFGKFDRCDGLKITLLNKGLSAPSLGPWDRNLLSCWTLDLCCLTIVDVLSRVMNKSFA